jgi:outer membrane lipoprotein carrier protein
MTTTTFAFAVALAALPALTPAPRPTAQQPSATATIDRAVAAYAKAKTARATFEQTLTNPLTGSNLVSRGELSLQQRPNRMSVRFTDPKGDRIVVDGTSLWVYLPSSNPGQVIKLPAGRNGVGGVDLVGELLTSPRTRYNVTDAGAATLDGRATRVVALAPKREGQQIAKARVWIDDRDATVRQFEVTDANGLMRTVRIMTWRANAPGAASEFRFAPPKGARVLDQAALTGL